MKRVAIIVLRKLEHRAWAYGPVRAFMNVLYVVSHEAIVKSINRIDQLNAFTLTTGAHPKRCFVRQSIRSAALAGAELTILSPPRLIAACETCLTQMLPALNTENIVVSATKGMR